MACSKEAACRRQISGMPLHGRICVPLEGDQDWSAGWHVSHNGAWPRRHRCFWVFGKQASVRRAAIWYCCRGAINADQGCLVGTAASVKRWLLGLYKCICERVSSLSVESRRCCSYY